MLFGDVEDDRACLEEGEIAVLIGGNQAERMEAQMRGFLLRTERNARATAREWRSAASSPAA